MSCWPALRVAEADVLEGMEANEVVLGVVVMAAVAGTPKGHLNHVRGSRSTVAMGVSFGSSGL